jgi:hypothetical protein
MAGPSPAMTVEGWPADGRGVAGHDGKEVLGHDGEGHGDETRT